MLLCLSLTMLSMTVMRDPFLFSILVPPKTSDTACARSGNNISVAFCRAASVFLHRGLSMEAFAECIVLLYACCMYECMR